jgi:hypothetical protein
MTLQATVRPSAEFVALAGLILLFPAPAHAHALHAHAKLDGNQVLVEAKFDGDEAAEKAKVYLISTDGEKTLRGRTGSDGTLRFDAPAPGKYEILVDAGAGHVAKVAITITEEMLRNAPASAPVLISEGPSIEEATSGKWWKIAVGLGAIALFGFVLWMLRRGRGPESGSARASPSRPPSG